MDFFFFFFDSVFHLTVKVHVVQTERWWEKVGLSGSCSETTSTATELTFLSASEVHGVYDVARFVYLDDVARFDFQLQCPTSCPGILPESLCYRQLTLLCTSVGHARCR